MTIIKKRNFKIFTHWLAELRDIAIANKVQNPDGPTADKQDLKWSIDRESTEDYFNQAMNPQEAFEALMEHWADNQD